MLGLRARLFGPSRAETRAACAAYLEQLREGAGGQIVPDRDIIRDFESERHAHGWPYIEPEVLLRELELLGCSRIAASKVPWSNTPKAKRAALPAPVAFEPTEATTPSPRRARTVQTKARKSTARDDALADLIERLEAGETIPSQETLANAWGRSEGTVSDWISGWRRAGLIPHPVREGRCNVIQMPRTSRAA
jgi:hypothetical protein